MKGYSPVQKKNIGAVWCIEDTMQAFHVLVTNQTVYVLVRWLDNLYWFTLERSGGCQGRRAQLERVTAVEPIYVPQQDPTSLHGATRPEHCSGTNVFFHRRSQKTIHVLPAVHVQDGTSVCDCTALDCRGSIAGVACRPAKSVKTTGRSYIFVDYMAAIPFPSSNSDAWLRLPINSSNTLNNS